VTDPGPPARALERVPAEIAPGLPVVRHLASGLVARQIVAYARRARIDLIVMGTHGRTGVSHALLGSVAEAVVRRASCRVLTVPARLPEPAAAAAAPAGATDVDAEASEVGEKCVVCGKPSPDLICEPCRALIRGEALERKLDEERAGRGPGTTTALRG
jgi:hypothetical protein